MEKEVKVSEKHVWVAVEDRHVYLGLTNYIQGELGKVISVCVCMKGSCVGRAIRIRVRTWYCDRTKHMFAQKS